MFDDYVFIQYHTKIGQEIRNNTSNIILYTKTTKSIHLWQKNVVDLS